MINQKQKEEVSKMADERTRMNGGGEGDQDEAVTQEERTGYEHDDGTSARTDGRKEPTNVTESQTAANDGALFLPLDQCYPISGVPPGDYEPASWEKGGAGDNEVAHYGDPNNGGNCDEPREETATDCPNDYKGGTQASTLEPANVAYAPTEKASNAGLFLPLEHCYPVAYTLPGEEDGEQDRVSQVYRRGVSKRQCSHENCSNNAVRGGVCVRHGTKKKPCSREGCERQAVKGGLCIGHGGKQAPKKRCSREGCTNNAVQDGICVKHGAQKNKKK